jgi:hypothetical protein
MGLFHVLLVLTVILSWSSPPANAQVRQSRESAAVAFLYNGIAIQQFLERPGVAYMQAHVIFGEGMPDDVIMAIDQEFLEGVSNPLYVFGGDWMSYVGIQRSGALWVSAGTVNTMAGLPSTPNWQIFDLEYRLQPNTWYLLRVVSDFGTRYFKSFTISGAGFFKTVDLSAFYLAYPNYLPFDGRSVICIVGAGRGNSMTGGTPVAYFDDVESGISSSDNIFRPLFRDGFDNQTAIGPQPVLTVPIQLSAYQQGKWYMEQPGALLSIEASPIALSPPSVAVLDATLN